MLANRVAAPFAEQGRRYRKGQVRDKKRNTPKRRCKDIGGCAGHHRCMFNTLPGSHIMKTPKLSLRSLRRGLMAVAGAAVVLASLGACAQAVARPGDMATMSAEDMSRMRQHMLERASRHLGLDEAQKQRLATVLDKLAEQRKAVMGADGDPRAKARELLAGNTFDRAGAQILIDQKTSAVRSAAPQVITAFGDFFDSLKPAQQQKVRDWMEHRGGRRWMGMGGGHEMHPGHGMGPGMPPGPPPAAAADAPKQ
jgi:Spy/CpxP family protein refolding chaperone